MKAKHKIAIGAGVLATATLLVIAVAWCHSLPCQRGNIYVRDAETGAPMYPVLTVFAVARTPSVEYPPNVTGPSEAGMTHRDGSFAIPDLTGPPYAGATLFRILVRTDGYQYYAQDFPRDRFGKSGLDAIPIIVPLQKRK
jgi:hypothetical protein